ncbi:hypothetical protein [Pseudomonas luteola]|uniref:hypothetical protein n=1 Tax=Pseudomonas luteola TaxID=47886 RepID=UPI0028981D4A|nr:hypothetical protein [Pseudomonas luteola]
MSLDASFWLSRKFQVAFSGMSSVLMACLYNPYYVLLFPLVYICLLVLEGLHKWLPHPLKIGAPFIGLFALLLFSVGLTLLSAKVLAAEVGAEPGKPEHTSETSQNSEAEQIARIYLLFQKEFDARKASSGGSVEQIKWIQAMKSCADQSELITVTPETMTRMASCADQRLKEEDLAAQNTELAPQAK